MFGPLTVPFGAVMLFNVVKLKEGVTQSDVELAMGEMCNVVKNTYGDDEGGVIGGQVYKYTGFVSEEGSFDSGQLTDDHIAIARRFNITPLASSSCLSGRCPPQTGSNDPREWSSGSWANRLAG